MYVYVVSWCWILLCHDAELCCVRCHSATDPTAFSVWPQVSVSMRLFPLVDLQRQLKGWTNAEDTAMVATGLRRRPWSVPFQADYLWESYVMLCTISIHSSSLHLGFQLCSGADHPIVSATTAKGFSISKTSQIRNNIYCNTNQHYLVTT